MGTRIPALATAMLAVMTPAMASAQALVCRPPARPDIPRSDLPSASQPKRVVPIGSYTLALTWNPGYCRANGGDADSRFQCGGGNRFGFTLHGLWPDGRGREWPQYCTSAEIVPPQVIRETMCSTPSAQLIQHEWAKHGTCMGVTPGEYFGTARRLYSALRYPDMSALSRRPLTVAGFKRAFASANPAVKPGAIRVTLTRDGWLDELWLCLDTRMRYESCRAGSGGAPDRARVKIWRGGR
ncbi:MAG: ribonuclease T [Sphingomonas sp.]